MLLPLALGLLVREQRPGTAGRLQPVFARASTVSLLTMVVAAIGAHYEVITGVGWRAALAALVIILGAFAIGYLVAPTGPDRREVLSLGTGQRNIAAATVVATQSFSQSGTVIMVITSSLIGLAVLFPIARMLRRAERARHPEY